MNEKFKSTLIEKARDARAASICPYSGISVGAALLTDTGKIYTGANIESASYSPTLCAERVALAKALSEGERNFSAIAIEGGALGEGSVKPFYPCGVCRQMLSEFLPKDASVLVTYGDTTEEYTLCELFPKSFGKEALE
jgi:cytidine deaminase